MPQQEPMFWGLYFYANAQWNEFWYSNSELKNCIASGQNSQSDGLFFAGGGEEQESTTKVFDFLAQFRGRKSYVQLDVHSGLGQRKQLRSGR